MRISYMLSSGLVLIAVGLMVVSAMLPIGLLHSPSPITEGNATGWDPCFMWEQMPQTARVAPLVFTGAFIIVMIQGLRDRAASRWLAIAGLAGMAVSVQHQLWRVMGCFTNLDKVGYFVWVGSVALMFLHHAATPRKKTIAQTPHP